MRELKFRAWDKEENGYINLFSKYPMYITFDGKAIKLEDYGCAEYEQDVIIEQFTGLSDKNGKEIFEGDVVKKQTDNPISDGVYEIAWHNPSASFSLKREGGWLAADLTKTEIIGNIHSNPVKE